MVQPYYVSSPEWRIYPLLHGHAALDSSDLTEYGLVGPWYPHPWTCTPHQHPLLTGASCHLTLTLTMTTALPWCFYPSVQVLWRGGLQRLEQKPVPRLQCPGAPGLRGALHLLHPEHGKEHGNRVGAGCGVTQFAKHCSPSVQVE